MQAFTAERFHDRAEAGHVSGGGSSRGTVMSIPSSSPFRAAVYRWRFPWRRSCMPRSTCFSCARSARAEQPEFALAAVVEGEPEEVTLNAEMALHMRIPADWLEARRAEAHSEIARQRARYCPGSQAARSRRALADLSWMTAFATGTTLRAAIARPAPAPVPTTSPSPLPVAPPGAITALRAEVDDVICPLRPRAFSRRSGSSTMIFPRSRMTR